MCSTNTISDTIQACITKAGFKQHVIRNTDVFDFHHFQLKTPTARGPLGTSWS